ncbi:UNVERIFIED_CONTAM: hypothetical protein Slati_2134600 [Sesamum latifolium]|uniref:Uncharacterized protein n=1 Tax=Sesamum latifolium TaxID=2727402 RepID=A0AAW2WT36_9LAMI
MDHRCPSISIHCCTIADDTKLDKIILVLSALCVKMGIPPIFPEVPPTSDAPVEGATQPTTEDVADPILFDELEALD